MYDNKLNRWKVLKGYSRIEQSYRVIYTENDWQRGYDGWEEYDETLLSLYE